MNKGWFRKGTDSRRHVFTPEECSRGGSQPTCHRLTNEHRQKGGHASWRKYMVQHRLDQGLPIPKHLKPVLEVILQDGDIPF